jgi:hypothetical protein
MSLIKKDSFLRLAKPEKNEFTYVNDYFEGKRNEKNRVFLQRLNTTNTHTLWIPNGIIRANCTLEIIFVNCNNIRV